MSCGNYYRSKNPTNIPDLSCERRNRNGVELFPGELLRRKLTLVDAHVQTMVRDGMTAVPETSEIPRCRRPFSSDIGRPSDERSGVAGVRVYRQVPQVFRSF